MELRWNQELVEKYQSKIPPRVCSCLCHLTAFSGLGTETGRSLQTVTAGGLPKVSLHVIGLPGRLGKERVTSEDIVDTKNFCELEAHFPPGLHEG